MIEFVKDAAEDALAKEAVTDAESNLSGEQLARQLLARFQFSPSRQQDLVSKLSGGERRRLQLMYVLAQRPNFLVRLRVREGHVLRLSIMTDPPPSQLAWTKHRYWMSPVMI